MPGLAKHNPFSSISVFFIMGFSLVYTQYKYYIGQYLEIGLYREYSVAPLHSTLPQSIFQLITRNTQVQYASWRLYATEKTRTHYCNYAVLGRRLLASVERTATYMSASQCGSLG